MELHDDMVTRLTSEDLDLRDDPATVARRRWLFGVIVGLDVIAIVAFVAFVVMSRFT